MKYFLFFISLIFLSCSNQQTQVIDNKYSVYQWQNQFILSSFSQTNNINSNANIKLNYAHNISNGNGIKIAIIDGNFDINHTSYKNSIIATYNVKTNTTDVSNKTNISSHGTMTLGMLASNDIENKVFGSAPRAKYILIGTIDKNDEEISDQVAIDAFYKAEELGAQVISCSWGTYQVSDSVSNVINELYNKGITIIFASGNDGYDLDSIYNDESELSSVIGVGGSSEYNNKATYANYGSNIDILAPAGENIGVFTSDERDDKGENNNRGYDINDNYTFERGTSFSAPSVAGVVALMLTQNKNLTPSQIREIIISTAQKIGNVTYNHNGFNKEYAYGKIDALAAVIKSKEY